MIRGKTLATLGLGALSPAHKDLTVSGLSVDSRKTEPGHLFAALPGSNLHGAEFADYARRMGAAAILTDRIGAAQLTDLALPVLTSPDPRLDLARAAARWYDAQPEVITAVTGTNGKTSVASFTRQIWEHAGLKAVNFGTTGVEGAVTAPLAHTTPEPITLHGLLADLAEGSITHAAMEASSHGLAQRRLDAVHLTAAGFTNITRDHLDYHDSFADYLDAKSALFSRVLGKGGTAVINIDDPNGPALAAAATARGQRVIRTGRADSADLRLTAQRFDASGQDIRLAWGGQAYMAHLSLIGGFQADNVAMAAGLVLACGGQPEPTFAALPHLTTVRGRMDLAATRDNGATIFVDYAHTPDALATALTNLRPHVLGRLIVVFGAGGDRDPGKRPMMGKAAKAHADVAYVTDDNPRTEDAATIRAQIMAAIPHANEIGDRAEAILAAVDALQPGDTLLIAGKGHETGQIIGQDVYPFDDAEAASIAVAALDGLGA